MLFYIILSVLPMFVCLFGVALLLIDPRKNLPKKYLTFFLILTCINYFSHAAFFNKQYELFAFMENIWVFTSLAGYPLYYYYIRLLTTDTKIEWKWSWILIPSILLSLYSFIIYFLMSPQELDIFIKGIMYHQKEYKVEPFPTLVRLQQVRLVLFKVIFLVQIVLTIFFGLKLISDYNKKLKDFYSNTKGKDLTPIRWVLIAFIFASVISAISSIVGKDFFVDREDLIIVPSLTHSMFLFFIIYVGYKQNFTIQDFEEDVKDYKKKKALQEVQTLKKPIIDTSTNEEIEEALDHDKNEELKQAMIDLVEKEKWFTKPDIRLTDIALHLGSNRTYVSHIVNEQMNTNFCDWINGYRLDYAKTLLNDKEHDYLTLTEISEMSGFSSVSMFYRVFKEKVGLTPGKYRDSRKS